MGADTIGKSRVEVNTGVGWALADAESDVGNVVITETEVLSVGKVTTTEVLSVTEVPVDSSNTRNNWHGHG